MGGLDMFTWPGGFNPFAMVPLDELTMHIYISHIGWDIFGPPGYPFCAD